jgi:hypothetical protein
VFHGLPQFSQFLRSQKIVQLAAKTFDKFISLLTARLIDRASPLFQVAECSLRQLTIPRGKVYKEGQIASGEVTIWPLSHFLRFVRFFAWHHTSFAPLPRAADFTYRQVKLLQ